MKKYIFLLLTLMLLTGCGAPKDTLSINGMYIGKKAPADRDHLVMDASFTYMDKEVGYDVDSENRIDYMEFYTSTMADDETGLDDIKLYYHGEHLDTTEKVIATLGKNYTPADGEKYESFEFEDDKLCVEVTLRNGEFTNINVTPK